MPVRSHHQTPSTPRSPRPYTRDHIATKHGLRAAFAPRVLMTSTSNAAHPTSPSTPPPSLRTFSFTKPPSLDYIQALPALPTNTVHDPASTPIRLKKATSPTSQGSAWSSGIYAHWGTENRESPICLTNATSPTNRRFEIPWM